MTRRRSKRKPIKKKTARRYLPLWLALGGAIAVIVALLLDFDIGGRRIDFSQNGAGAPVLAVDHESVDYGDVQLGTPITTEFVVRNEGTADLKFTKKPYVEVKEGC